ncbi:hypothetical protein C8R45DRAFT_273409 [Mycena sanguinolenta]|nr:hypothetical protein C8R45DRAFT_273409 [Mycena sanguinolenta]
MSLNGFLRTSQSLRYSALSPVSRRTVSTLRPTTWSARIWFRANGTPRRVVLGLVLSSCSLRHTIVHCFNCDCCSGSLLSGILYTRWTIHKDLHTLGVMQDMVSSLVRIQCVDSAEYARVDFSSYRAALNYFNLPFVFGKHLQNLNLVAVDMQLAGSLLEHTDKRNEAHAIMCKAAESVHKLLAEAKNEPHPATTGQRVLVALLEAARELVRLVIDLDGIDPADKIKLHDVQMAVKGVETKNHEVLG